MDRIKPKHNVYRNCRNCTQAFIVEFHLTRPGEYGLYKCPGCKFENWVEINPDPKVLTGNEVQEVKRKIDEMMRAVERKAEAENRN